MSSIEPEVVFPERSRGGRTERSRAFRFGAVFGAMLGLLGFLLARRHGDSVWGLAAMGTGAGVFVLAIVSPRAALAVEKLWFRAAGQLGRVNGAIILALLYVVVVTPLGLLFRRSEGRSFARAGGGSTFVPRKTKRDPKHFERPY